MYQIIINVFVKFEIEWHVEVAEQEHPVDVKVTVAAIQVAATG